MVVHEIVELGVLRINMKNGLLGSAMNFLTSVPIYTLRECIPKVKQFVFVFTWLSQLRLLAVPCSPPHGFGCRDSRVAAKTNCTQTGNIKKKSCNKKPVSVCRYMKRVCVVAVCVLFVMATVRLHVVIKRHLFILTRLLGHVKYSLCPSASLSH